MKDGGQAFPRDNGKMGDKGMSLRDYFAGQVLAGVCAKLPPVDAEDTLGFNTIWCESCYAVADAMIEERDNDAK